MSIQEVITNEPQNQMNLKYNHSRMQYVHTVLSLLEAPGAKTLSRVLLFHVILHVIGALIGCYWRMII